jgi:hypothetical protein
MEKFNFFPTGEKLIIIYFFLLKKFIDFLHVSIIFVSGNYTDF